MAAAVCGVIGAAKGMRGLVNKRGRCRQLDAVHVISRKCVWWIYIYIYTINRVASGCDKVDRGERVTTVRSLSLSLARF